MSTEKRPRSPEEEEGGEEEEEENVIAEILRPIMYFLSAFSLLNRFLPPGPVGDVIAVIVLITILIVF